MKNNNNKQTIIILAVIVFLLIGTVVVLMITTKPMPIRLMSEYGVSLLWTEAKVMDECAECHDSTTIHSCETCHDDHGSVELENIPFSEIVQLTGDVPNPAFVRVNQVIPDQKNLGTHITLFDFLELYGVIEFHSINFITNDGGFTTIESQYLDETAMLVPYVDGLRFVTESVHVSTWLKGIERITVVSNETPLTIDGSTTSIGRLLLGETLKVVVEGTDVMLTNDSGDLSHAYVANWVEGARLLPLLRDPSPDFIIITNESGQTTRLDGNGILDAIIANVRGEITLVLPDRGRSAWPTSIIKIESGKTND